MQQPMPLATTEGAGVPTPESSSMGVSLLSAVDLMYSPEYFGGLEKLASAAAASKLFGDSTKDQLFMILMTGRELGLSPTVALRNIGVFKGKTTISSQLQVSLCRRAGYIVEILEQTAQRAKVRLVKGNRAPYDYTFTMDDARTAGLIDRNALYKSIPAVMLLNRALGFACRYGAPEVLNGLHNESELDELDVVPVHVPPRADAVGEPEAPSAPSEPEPVSCLTPRQIEAVRSRGKAMNVHAAVVEYTILHVREDDRKVFMDGLFAGKREIFEPFVMELREKAGHAPKTEDSETQPEAGGEA